MQDINKKNYKKPVTCTNCAKIGHYFKHCNEPIISIGIIIIKIEDTIQNLVINNRKITKELLLDNLKNNIFNILINKRFINKSFINLFQDKIKFLLIRRKHTFNFVSFINGKYNPDDMPEVCNIFKFMTKKEIQKIKTLEFDALWNDVWNCFGIDTNHYNYVTSKTKYQELKDKSKFNLDFFINNIESEFTAPEWGIPKGKRNLMESDEECAIREVFEETGLGSKSYELIETIKPVVENILKINGISYKYKYFVGLHKEGTTLNEEEILNNGEIGDIGWFTINEINNLIRPYYKQRINILQKLYYFIVDKLIN